MKRICNGYYTASATTTLDNIKVKCAIELVKIACASEWYFIVTFGSKMLSAGADWYGTKKEAIEALESTLTMDFISDKEFGVCVDK